MTIQKRIRIAALEAVPVLLIIASAIFASWLLWVAASALIVVLMLLIRENDTSEDNSNSPLPSFAPKCNDSNA